MFMSDDKNKRAGGMAVEIDMPDKADEYDGHQAAADEVMSAIESKDPAALKEALKSFVEMCSYSNDDASESE